MKNSKSLCILIPHWPTAIPGGAELQCYLISEWLIKKQWKIEVISEGNKDFKSLNSRYYNNKIKYIFIKPYKLKTIGFFRILISLLKTRSYFYYNRTDARLMRAVCIIYCKLFKKKSLYAIAHDDELIINNYADNIQKNRGLFYYLLKKADAELFDKFSKQFHFKADKIISQTYDQQKQLNKKFNIQSEVIRNSIHVLPSNDFVKENIILWVGNMRPVKKPEIFLKMCNELDLINWKFVVIGNTFDYGHRFEQLNLPNLEILGQLSYEDTLEYFKKSKILVNTSQLEGFSNTFIQAWLFGLIVISLSVDPDDLLRNGLGYYCKNNFITLKHYVNLITETYDSSKQLLIKAKKFALKEFNLENNMVKLEKLLKEIE